MHIPLPSLSPWALLHLQVTDRWQYVVWREFKRHGLDVEYCFEGASPDAPGTRAGSPLLPADETEEAEAQVGWWRQGRIA